MHEELDRRAFLKVCYGLYIVTSFLDDRLNGLIANTVCQVTSRPPRVSVCLHKDNLTHEYISKSGVFSVSVLSESAPLKFIGIFGFNSGRKMDKLSKVSFKRGETGCPLVIENTVAVFEMRVVNSIDVGTHTIFVGDVVSAEVLRPGKPLTYSFYRESLKGKTPKYAPTYMAEMDEAKLEKGERSGKMKKYVCDVCGYIYDPAAGDPRNGVEPGTPFEKISDDWVCPICGAGKDQFSPEG